jgi:hypothetical protein
MISVAVRAKHRIFFQSSEAYQSGGFAILSSHQNRDMHTYLQLTKNKECSLKDKRQPLHFIHLYVDYLQETNICERGDKLEECNICVEREKEAASNRS